MAALTSAKGVSGVGLRLAVAVCSAVGEAATVAVALGVRASAASRVAVWPSTNASTVSSTDLAISSVGVGKTACGLRLAQPARKIVRLAIK